jgi:rSAM/selenodomain-associated transferase 1
MTITLVVFCRRPQPGIGKKRIAADLGATKTSVLAEHLLATTLEDASHWTGPVVLAPATEDDTAWAGELLDRPCEVMAQPEGNLGVRINTVDRELRQAGHTHLIFVGSDAPILDADYFARAATALSTHDAVLGPADDGGVTLMGSGRAWPQLAGLPWSSANLGDALELICIKEGLTVYSLDRRYDIDRANDLPRLYGDLRNDKRPARRRLRKWLAESGLQ